LFCIQLFAIDLTLSWRETRYCRAVEIPHAFYNDFADHCELLKMCTYGGWMAELLVFCLVFIAVFCGLIQNVRCNFSSKFLHFRQSVIQFAVNGFELKLLADLWIILTITVVGINIADGCRCLQTKTAFGVCCCNCYSKFCLKNFLFYQMI